MKQSTPLKQPSGWFPFLVVVVPCLWGLSFWLWDWPLGAITACISVFLVQDAWNLVRGKGAGEKDPKALKKNVPES